MKSTSMTPQTRMGLLLIGYHLGRKYLLNVNVIIVIDWESVSILVLLVIGYYGNFILGESGKQFSPNWAAAHVFLN